MRPLPTSQTPYAKTEQNGTLASGSSMAAQGQAISTPQYAVPTLSYATPSMWQESVASVYETGQKRRWDFNDSDSGSQSYKRNQ